MGKPDEQWLKKIREAKTLTIRSEAEAGAWTGALAECVPIFNRIALNAMKYAFADGAAANVVIKIAGSGKHDPQLGGTATHGITRRAKQVEGRGGIGIAEAEIFLPADASSAGKNLILMILLHEMGHAAGLEEHTSDGVMMTVPNVDQNGNVYSTPKSKKMPPFFFTNKTVNRLRTIWKSG